MINCRLLYKLRGPNAPLNFGMTDEEKQKLDGMTLQELLAVFHPNQGNISGMPLNSLLLCNATLCEVVCLLQFIAAPCCGVSTYDIIVAIFTEFGQFSRVKDCILTLIV